MVMVVREWMWWYVCSEGTRVIVLLGRLRHGPNAVSQVSWPRAVKLCVHADRDSRRTAVLDHLDRNCARLVTRWRA
jgi:hypothetical protein